MAAFHDEWWVELEGTLSVAACAAHILLDVVFVDGANYVVHRCVFLTQEHARWHFLALTSVLNRKGVLLHIVHDEVAHDLARTIRCAHVGKRLVPFAWRRTELPLRRSQLLEGDKVLSETF